MQTKFCSKCGIEKSFNEFHKQTKGRFGVQSQCKTCRIAYDKIYKKTNIEALKASNKIYKKNNLKKYKKMQKRWQEANAEHSKEYRKKNAKKVNDRSKAWSKANPERKKELNMAYRKNNKEKVTKLILAWQKNKLLTDPKFKLNIYTSGSICKSLKGSKAGRKWESLVGYTLKQLVKHLEKQFTEGMNWDNYGKDGWEVDHKIPVSVFNFTKPEQIDFKRCWALLNLQPMWRSENRSKGAKLTKHFQPSLLL